MKKEAIFHERTAHEAFYPGLKIAHYLGELFITGLSFTEAHIVLCNKRNFPLQRHITGFCT